MSLACSCTCRSSTVDRDALARHIRAAEELAETPVSGASEMGARIYSSRST